jgi:hypothetical protein
LNKFCALNFPSVIDGTLKLDLLLEAKSSCNALTLTYLPHFTWQDVDEDFHKRLREELQLKRA